MHAKLVLAVALGLVWPAAAQEGYHGQGHDTWHQDFYSKLVRPDTKTSCCNLADCRPTQVRTVEDHYEVLLDGRWVKVPYEKIVHVRAPDGGAHVCAPPPGAPITQNNPDFIYCVVLPTEI